MSDGDDEDTDGGEFGMSVGEDGEVTFVGRPPWGTKAAKIPVNSKASKGPVEDRRHMLHWGEQLRPILASVMTAMFQLHGRSGPAIEKALRDPLKGRVQRIVGTDAHAIAERVAKEINGAVINLVADRADMNKAIEHVRARVRNLTRRLTDDPALTAKVAKAMREPFPNDAIMDVYLDEAAQELLGGTSDSTAIKSQVQDIGFQIVGLVQSCRAPCDFVMMLHHVADSVTFDLSQKAEREQTRRTLEWLRRMEANVREPADIRYEALLTLLD
ncbi:MAG: hypothetical protein J0I71_12705 [Rhodanobacter sp.]|nr:hypothetical protein [Rhodanobacter sp.]